MRKIYEGNLLVLIAFLSVIAIGSSAAIAYDGPWWPLFDYTISPNHYGTTWSPNIDEYGFDPTHPEITPVPRPGAYLVWDDPRITTLYDRVLQENRPLAIYLNCYTAPLTGSKDPQALSKTMDYLGGLPGGRLDYVFMEFETSYSAGATAEAKEAVRQVRNHSNPQINQAFCGNYNYFACTSTPWYWHPDDSNNQDEVNGAYVEANLNVAMPQIYPVEKYEKHADVELWRTTHYYGWDIFHLFPYYTHENVAPNKRSALFWAPLTKFSEAKKALPAGHQLFPYINDFCPCDGFDATAPPKEDNAALVKHIRLRGTDSYYIWRTYSENEPEPYDNDTYRTDMLAAWKSLDWLFADCVDELILNLETDKPGGFQWSAVQTEDGVAVILSNLGNDEVLFEFQTLVDAGMDPEYVEDLYYGQDHVYVSPGEHLVCSVPEPATMGLLVLGGLVMLRRGKKLF